MLCSIGLDSPIRKNRCTKRISEEEVKNGVQFCPTHNTTHNINNNKFSEKEIFVFVELTWRQVMIMDNWKQEIQAEAKTYKHSFEVISKELENALELRSHMVSSFDESSEESDEEDICMKFSLELVDEDIFFLSACKSYLQDQLEDFDYMISHIDQNINEYYRLLFAKL